MIIMMNINSLVFGLSYANAFTILYIIFNLNSEKLLD